MFAGKTTLSADPERYLIGDDEHGWDNNGIFNFEGGCYAKCINLSKEKEPMIYNAIRRDTVLENLAVGQDGVIDFTDKTKTENTRAAYPLHFIDNFEPTSQGGHPKNIIFLTADAFGVLPPVAKLSPQQAMYHFISGYTAKVAGTERGIKEPVPAFSACFGAAFLPLHPTVYAKLLEKKMQKYQANAYLVNTGWTGGSFPKGKRFDLPVTRACIDAILSGEIGECERETCVESTHLGNTRRDTYTLMFSGLVRTVKILRQFCVVRSCLCFNILCVRLSVQRSRSSCSTLCGTSTCLSQFRVLTPSC